VVWLKATKAQERQLEFTGSAKIACAKGLFAGILVWINFTTSLPCKIVRDDISFTWPVLRNSIGSCTAPTPMEGVNEYDEIAKASEDKRFLLSRLLPTPQAPVRPSGALGPCHRSGCRLFRSVGLIFRNLKA